MTWSRNVDQRILFAVVQLARQATERRPTDALLWQRLGEAQLRVGALEAAIASFREALRLLPQNQEVLLLLASAYERSRNYQPALEILQLYLLDNPADQRVKIRHFEASVGAAKWDIAAGLAASIEQLDPGNPALFLCESGLALKDGRWHDLLRACEIKLKESPAHTSATYYRSLALAKLGRAGAAASMDLAKFVWTGDLPHPSNYQDADGFRGAIKDEILRNPTLRPDPRGLTTRNGFQTEHLEQPDSVAVRALLAQIRIAVDGYSEWVKGAEPLFRYRPRAAHLSAWAVVYTDSGRQLPHFHARGWISGAYYVTAPKVKDGTKDGALLLGTLPGDGAVDPPWGVRAVPATPGQIVLFPSWIPHSTAPTYSKESRICVAFDVVPVN